MHRQINQQFKNTLQANRIHEVVPNQKRPAPTIGCAGQVAVACAPLPPPGSGHWQLHTTGAGALTAGPAGLQRAVIQLGAARQAKPTKATPGPGSDAMGASYLQLEPIVDSTEVNPIIQQSSLETALGQTQGRQDMATPINTPG